MARGAEHSTSVLSRGRTLLYGEVMLTCTANMMTVYKQRPKPEKRHHSERGDGGGVGRSSSSASAAGAEDDAIVKHSITEQGRTIIIYGSRQATANFGLNIGTSHLELGGKRSKKRGL